MSEALSKSGVMHRSAGYTPIMRLKKDPDAPVVTKGAERLFVWPAVATIVFLLGAVIVALFR